MPNDRRFIFACLAAAILLASCGGRFVLNTPRAGHPSERREPAPQPKPAQSQPAGSKQPMLPIYTNLGDPPSIEARWNEWNVKKAYIMYQHEIDPGRTNRWTSKDLTFRWLGQNVPKDFDGPICLDWEVHVLDILPKGPENNPEWKPVVAEMVALLKYVREQRPKAKVGYYALPSTKYWNQNQEYTDRQLALKEIYDASSALFPSAYDLYGENPERDRAAFTTVMQLALRCAAGKPVYVYTWHRYHDGDTPWGFRMIPEDEYIDHIRTLVKAEWKGDRIDGIVTWGADRYWYNSGQQRKADGSLVNTGKNWDRVRECFGTELKSEKSFDAYFEKLCATVYCRLAEAVNGVPCSSNR